MSKPSLVPTNLIPIGQKAWIPASSTQLFYHVPSAVDLHIDAKIAYLPVTVKGYDQDRKFGQYTLDWDEKLTIRCNVDNALPRALKSPQELLIPNESFDLSHLEFAHDASIVWELMLKYKKQQYFAKVGTSSTIVLLNPMESDTRLFNNPPTEVMNRSAKSPRRRSSINIAASTPPGVDVKPDYDPLEDLQVFSNKLYQSFLASNKIESSVAVVFQGCCGSGKTEAMKYLVQFIICQASARASQLDFNPKHSSYRPLGSTKNPFIIPPDMRYADAFAMALRVMDYFTSAGNMKNETSSRHTKRISLYYNMDNRFMSCGFDITYLDYQRICHIDTSQRPYQILQYLILSLSSDANQCSKYKLTPDIIATYTSNLTATQRDDMIEEFEYFIGRLLTLGLPQAQLSEIMNCLVACVHLQSIIIDGVDTASLATASKTTINTIEELLGLTYGSLAPCFLVKVDERLGSMRGTAIDCRPQEAIAARDIFAHELYARILKYLLNFCSQVITSHTSDTVDSHDMDAIKTVHIIDPPGWEVLPTGETNSISQLNMNYVYEKSTGYYISSCFASHRKKYADNPDEISGMKTSVASSPDDEMPFFISDCLPYIDIFERPSTGLISILEDISQAIRGDDKIFTDKVLSIHARNKQIRSAGHKASNTSFIVKHTFGDVQYDTSGFVMYNKARLSLQAKTLFATMNYGVMLATTADCDDSGNMMPIEDLLGNDGDNSNRISPRKRSSLDMNAPRNALLLSRSREQMSKLCMLLGENNNHYVLCVRPSISSSGYYDPEYVLSQVRALYLSSLTQFMKSGYAWCKSYTDFYMFFRAMLSPFHHMPRNLPPDTSTSSSMDTNPAVKSMCMSLLEICLTMIGSVGMKIYDCSGVGSISTSNSMNKDDHMILLSKNYICLKERVMHPLLDLRSKQMTRMHRVVTKLQAIYHMKKARRYYRRTILTNIIMIQAYVRRYLMRIRYHKQCHALLILQRMLRMFACRSLYHRRRQAGLTIKTYIFHKVLMQLRYRHMQRLVSQLQALAHGYRTRQNACYISKAVIVTKQALRHYLHRHRLYKKKQVVILIIQRIVRGHLIRLQEHRIVNILSLRRKQRIAQRVVNQIQAIFRQRYHQRKYQKLLHACRIIQCWIRARFLRQTYLLTKYLGIWIQKQWRRLQAMRKVSNLRMSVMVLLEQTRIWKFRAQELSYLRSSTSSTLSTSSQLVIGHRTYRAGRTKATRRIIGYDTFFDLNDIYDHNHPWMKSMVDFVSQLKQEEKQSVMEIAIGAEHTIILDSSANLYSFGSGDSGQLGHNNRQSLSTPTRMDSMSLTIHASEASYSASHPLTAANHKLHTTQVMMLCCGRAHTLLLASSGRMYSWGNNRRGQLGHSHFETCALPRMVGQDLIESAFDKTAAKNAIITRNVKHIACGAYHSACIADPGYLYTWGAGACLGRTRELLGGNTLKGAKITMTGRKDADSTCPDSAEPSIPYYFAKRRVQHVVCGDAHTAVRSYTDFYSWGRNSHGQLGIGDTQDTLLPTRILLPSYKEAEAATACITTGGRHMALLVAGKVWCWGWNSSGQVGCGHTNNISSPMLISLPDTMKGASIKQLVAGWQFTSAISSTNQVLLWGAMNILNEAYATTYDEMVEGNGKLPIRLAPQAIIIPEAIFGHTLGLHVMNSATMSILSIDSDDFSSTSTVDDGVIGMNSSTTFPIDTKSNALALANATIGNSIPSSSSNTSRAQSSRSTSPAASIRSTSGRSKNQSPTKTKSALAMLSSTTERPYRVDVSAKDTSNDLLRMTRTGPIISSLIRDKLGTGISIAKLTKRRLSMASRASSISAAVSDGGGDDHGDADNVKDPADKHYAMQLQRRLREGELADDAMISYFSLSRHSSKQSLGGNRPTLMINTSATSSMTNPYSASSPLNPAAVLSNEEREEFERLKLSSGRGINMPSSERNILLKFTSQRRESHIKHLNDLLPSASPVMHNSDQHDLISVLTGSFDPNLHAHEHERNESSISSSNRTSRAHRAGRSNRVIGASSKNKSTPANAANRLGLSAESVRSLNNAIDSLRLDIRQLEYPRSRRSIGSLLPSSSTGKSLGTVDSSNMTSSSAAASSTPRAMRATTGSIGLSLNKKSNTSPIGRSSIKRRTANQTSDGTSTRVGDKKSRDSSQQKSVRIAADTDKDNYQDPDSLHAADVRDLAVLLQAIKRENIQQIAGSWKY